MAGSSVTDTTLSHALEHASERGRLSQATSLHGPIWDLTDAIRIDAEQARIVAEELFAQARSTLHSDARRLLRESPDGQQLNLWFELLLEAIDTGLRPLLVEGRATKIGGIRLAPARIDADSVRRFLSERVHDPDSVKFLEAKAIAVLDPPAPFWNDLVHFICVGFLFYRHVGRLQHRTAPKV